MPTLHGGYARPTWGTRSFSPDLFVGDWPPPKTITVVDKLTETTEAAAVTIFNGTLHLESYTESEVVYIAYAEEHDVKITDFSENNTLITVFTTYCGASYLNLTLDSTLASSSPIVTYAVTGESMLIDILSDCAAFFSHAFYISGSTLYLISLANDNNTSTLDEFEFFMGSEYVAPIPYSIFKASTRHLYGTYAYGEEYEADPVCSTNTTQIDSALTQIKTNMEKDFYRFKVIPEAGYIPEICDKVTVTNNSLQDDTTTVMNVTGYMVDVINDEIIIEGIGSST